MVKMVCVSKITTYAQKIIVAKSGPEIFIL